jgi:prepilin-type N-terminal cleavage/methylation domain-containing protein
MRISRSDRGFTLVEVLVATVLLSTAVVAMAALFGLAGLSIRNARRQSVATLMAAGKLAELRVMDEVAAVSPEDALVRDVDGFVDYLDAGGRWVAGGSQPPPEAVYVRRWSVQPLSEDPVDTHVVQVLVTSVTQARQASAAGSVRRPGDALIVSLRTRRR